MCAPVTRGSARASRSKRSKSSPLQLFAHDVLGDCAWRDGLDLALAGEVDSVDLYPQLRAALEFGLEDFAIAQRADQQLLHNPLRAFDLGSELNEQPWDVAAPEVETDGVIDGAETDVTCSTLSQRVFCLAEESASDSVAAVGRIHTDDRTVPAPSEPAAPTTRPSSSAIAKSAGSAL